MSSLPRRKIVLFVSRGSNEEDKADEKKKLRENVHPKINNQAHLVIGCNIKRFAKNILEANESQTRKRT